MLKLFYSVILLWYSSQSIRPEPSQAKSFLDIGNRRILNEDHDQLRVIARKFFANHVSPYHDKSVIIFSEFFRLVCLAFIYQNNNNLIFFKKVFVFYIFYYYSFVLFLPRWDEQQQVPRSIWKEAGHNGFLGITTSEVKEYPNRSFRQQYRLSAFLFLSDFFYIFLYFCFFIFLLFFFINFFN